eukprot:GCRY01005284.1.p1 GENE.GCRY01005284.1~~GCRY01005284.1.p1  ORF type:complete len:226 (+),score=64.97 GCRY01005284.1:63-740(+)
MTETIEKKKSFHYTPAVDINVLKEVIAVNPFEKAYGGKMEAWKEVVENAGIAVSASGIKKRVEYLMSARKKDECENLKKSGTEEEYAEREMLQDDLIQMEQAEEENAAQISKRKKRLLEEMTEKGKEIQNAALHTGRNIESSKKQKTEASEFSELLFAINEGKSALEKEKMELRRKELEDKEAERKLREKELEYKMAKMKEEAESRKEERQMMRELMKMLAERNN